MESSSLISLLLISGLAVLMPLVAVRMKRVQIPTVVLEIIAGIIIGKSGFNLIHPDSTLTFLAEFGFAYLMFLSGLEVDFGLLLPQHGEKNEPFYRRTVFLGVAMLTLTLLLAGLAGLWLVKLGVSQSAVLIGLIMSTTSMGIVVPVLKERRLLASEYGQALLLAALLADLVTLLLISIVIAMYQKGPSLELLLVLLLGVVFAALARMGHWLARQPRLQQLIDELSHASAQLPVRLALALLVGWEALSRALGLEIILGAFMAGALISLVALHDSENFRFKLDAIGYGFFIPIFFISVGIELDFHSLLNSPTALTIVPLLILLAYAVKIIPALIYRVRFPWRDTFAIGVLLSSRLSLIIAASSIAMELGLLTPAANAAIILVALVTCTLSPAIFNRLVPTPSTTETRQGLIIIGDTDIAVMLAQRLVERGEGDITLIGREGARPFRSLPPEVTLISCRECPPTAEILASGGAAQAAALVSLQGDEQANVALAQMAKEQFGIPNVIAVTNSSQHLTTLRTMGVRVVQPSIALLFTLEGALEHPAAFDLLNQLHGIRIAEGRLCNTGLQHNTLRELQLPGDVLVMGIRRGEEMLMPHGDTHLRPGDIIILVGPEQAVDEALAWLEGSCARIPRYQVELL